MGKRLGLISLLLGVGLFLTNLVVWGIFFVLVVGGGDIGRGADGSLVMQGLGGLAILTVVGYLVGLGLGIAGLVRREPRLYLAVLGTGVNALLLLGVILLALLSVLGASA